MIITIDTSAGGKEEIAACVAALQAYNNSIWGFGSNSAKLSGEVEVHRDTARSITVGIDENRTAATPRPNQSERVVVQSLARGYGATESTAQLVADQVATTMGFIPGPVAAAAPSDAGAAASQTAPEAPTAGVPPPPTESAPPAAAPTASSAPAAPSTSAQGVDVTGLPWDGRIHAANAGKNADGRWRKKKGLNDAAYVARIETELRTGGTPAPAAPPASAPPPPTLTDVVVPPPPVTAAAPVAPPPPPAGPDVSTFPGFLQWLTPLMTTGKLPFPIIMAELAKHSMSQLSDLNDPVKAQKLPEIYAALAATVK